MRHYPEFVNKCRFPKHIHTRTTEMFVVFGAWSSMHISVNVARKMRDFLYEQLRFYYTFQDLITIFFIQKSIMNYAIC